ncbi:MAG: hypothetical protein PHE93_02740 [Clostridia bacterium]|nr:hypothetical protein [Clostridia bacterium]
MKKVLKWYKLDNAAKLYPMLITKNSQSLFRISVLLLEEVNEGQLKQALNDIMPRFPSFAVELRSGLFWYYFEENNRPVKVFTDDGIMLKPIDVAQTNYYWFRVSYFSRKINLEMFHAISDAGGGMQFLKALLHRYFTLGGQEIGNDNVMSLLDEPTENEVEDSFQTQYQKTKLKDMDLKSFTGKAPMNLTGTLFNGQGYGSIFGTMSVEQVKAKAKEYGTNLNAFLCAMLIVSIVKTYGVKSKQKPIIMMIPVDLRRLYGNISLRNFVLFTRLTITPTIDKTLEDYIKECDEQLKIGTKKESMQSQLNTTVRSEKTLIFKLMPLPLKFLAFKLGKIFLKSRQTIIFSNLGKVALPQNMKIDKMVLGINVGRNAPLNAGAVAVGDKLVVSFTRDIIETEVERNFFTALVKLGINVKVASNFREEQNVL